MDNDLHENSMMDFMNGLSANVSSTESLAYNNRFHTITLNRALLSQTYLEHGIIQVLIDQPIDDAFRGGITITSPELSADDLKKLDAFIAMNQVIETYSLALKWSRLFGGSGIIINAGQDMTKPLNINAIKENTPLEFYAADRWELSYSPSGMSLVDQFKTDDVLPCPYNYYGQPINSENVIKIKNKEAPSLLRGQFGGWGVSEIEKIIRSYNQYLKHQNVTYEILDESKVDVFKISGFNSAIATRDGAQKTANRISAASKIKNYQNALVVDKEDDYEQKTLGFGGVSEILTQIRIGLACDLRMPMTKLFGLSAAGFGSGLDDIENYNGMIESDIRSKVKLGMLKVITVCCQKVFGYIPENIAFEFKPLRVMSAEQESSMKTNALNRITTAVNSGLCSSEKAVELINGEKIFCSDLEESEAIPLQTLKKMGIDQMETSVEEGGSIGKEL
jgi:hypothetical protein